MPVTWNLSPHRRVYERADVLVLSVGKSGRTWLRVLINKCLSLHFNVPFGIGDLHADHAAIPSVCFDHEMWSHYSDATWIHRLLGSNIAPESILRRKKVVLIYRDPRDVVVSLYFHKTRRSRRRMDVDISRFIRHPNYGIENIIRVMNLWRGRLTTHPDCFWLSYERLKADTVAELARLMVFIGLTNVSEHAVREAVTFAEFENMKKMEATNAFGDSILRARNVSDPNSYKVREGSVGGYVKHFDQPDLQFLNQAITGLDSFYGYAASASIEAAPAHAHAVGEPTQNTARHSPRP